MQIDIRQAEGEDDIEMARGLFLEYQASIDVDLGYQGFTDEVASLPGAYAAPRGRLLLAEVDGVTCACIALRPLNETTCEIKRLYVRPSHRGLGLGRTMVTRVLEEAQAIGYGQVYLDTLPSMSEATAIYVSFGFEDVPPYRFSPVPGTRFMAITF